MLFDDDLDEDELVPQGVRVHVFIAGRVQGVCFRIYTRRQAQQIGVTGWVRNRWDGRVEAVFEGSDYAVKQAISWCHQGSPEAHVDSVEVVNEPSSGEFRSFNIR